MLRSILPPLLALAALAAAAPAAAAAAAAAPPDSAARLAVGVAQLRASIGAWDVTTEFLDSSGAVARSVRGAYRFEWVAPDRVVQGRSDIPELGQSSAITFYVRERTLEIEMASVGADGRLWIMTGPVDGEVRTTADVATADGGTMRLRFTRHAITADGFESTMEYSLDRGATWTRGNHQVFRRAAANGADGR